MSGLDDDDFHFESGATVGREPTFDPEQTVAQDAAKTKHPSSGGLHVRCPHCQSPIELVPDAQLESILCSSCGSEFSIVGDETATRMAEAVTQVGHFRLIDRVGMGAFGAVWKALDTKLDRTVAVKIPRKGQFDEQQEKAFVREAQNAAQLNHPGIVPVYEVGRDGDTLFIVSEFIRGLTLADWLTGQQLTAREAAELVVAVADALEHAHEHGVVHRDLKPGNIMLDESGRPHLMDFGLAKRDAAEITMSLDGQVLGTPAYMSPEQAEGDAHAADRRSDVYSLGVILFQLLTGELPFRGNARMLIHQVVNDEPPSPRKLNSALSRDLETITLKCLEKDPGRRYPTAAAVAEELGRWLRGEPIKARPVSGVTKAAKWVRRNPLPAGSLAVVMLSLLAVAGVMTRSFQREALRNAELSSAYTRLAESSQKTSDALIAAENSAMIAEQAAVAERESRVRAFEAVEKAELAERLAKEAEKQANSERDRTLQLINFQAAEHALDDGDLGEAFVRLQAADKIAPRWEYGGLYSQVVRRARRWFSPIYRFDIDRTPTLARLVLPKNREALERGECWVVVADAEGVEVRQAADGEAVARIEIGGAGDSGVLSGRVDAIEVVAPALPSARPRVAVTTAGDGLLVLAVPSLEVVARGPTDLRPTQLSASRAAPRLVAAQGSVVTVIDADTGAPLAETDFSEFDRVSTISISEDGATAAVGPFSVQNKPIVWRWENNEKRELQQTLQSFSFAGASNLVGKYSWSTQRSDSRYYAIDLDSERVSIQSSIGLGDVGARGEFQSWRTRGVLGVARRAPSGLAIGVIPDASLEDPAGDVPLDAAIGVRATDLMPQLLATDSAEDSVLLDFNPFAAALLAARGRRLEVYAPQQAARWMLDTRKSVDRRDRSIDRRLLGIAGQTEDAERDREPVLSYGCSLWSAQQRGRMIWTSNDPVLVGREIIPGETLPKVKAWLRPGLPKGVDLRGRFQTIVGVAPNTAGDRVWVLWEGADTFLHTQRRDSKDLLVALYDPKKNPSPDPENRSRRLVQPIATFRLSLHPEGGARVVRDFFVSGSEQSLVVASETVVACYDAQTGELRHRLPSTHSFAVSPDHRYFAGASWRQSLPARVWDVDSGQEVFATEEKQPIVKMAFGADSSELLVGWKEGRLGAYDLASGEQRLSVRTRVAPVCMIPGASRFVGFVPESGPMGELVLADTADGRPLSTLAEGLHVLTKCYANDVGSALSIIRKSQVDLIPRITASDATRMLEELDPACREEWGELLAKREFRESEWASKMQQGLQALKQALLKAADRPEDPASSTDGDAAPAGPAEEEAGPLEKE